MSTKIVINGVTAGRNDYSTIPAEVLDTIIVRFPHMREPLDPDNKPKDVEFIRNIAIYGQTQAGVGKLNAQDLVELGPGSRRLSAIRDYINKDPQQWGAKGPMAYNVKIRTIKTDRELLDLIVGENLHRENPSPIRLAHTASEYKEVYNLTLPEIGAMMGVTAARVEQWLKLLRFPDKVQKLVDDRVLPEATARGMLGLPTEAIDAAVKDLEAGVKSPTVKRSVDRARRELGKKTARSITDLRLELRTIRGDRAEALAGWLEGEATAVDLALILADTAFEWPSIDSSEV